MRQAIFSIAAFLLLTATSGTAQVGDISLSGGLFINSNTFTEGTSLFSVGASAWGKFSLSEKVQIGASAGVYVGTSTGDAFLGYGLVDTRVIDVPVFGNLIYKIGNPDAWYAFIGAQAGGYYTQTTIELLGVELISETDFLPAVGLLAGFEVPISDQFFVQARTGVDFLFVPEEEIDGETFEAETAVVLPVALGLGLRF